MRTKPRPPLKSPVLLINSAKLSIYRIAKLKEMAQTKVSKLKLKQKFISAAIKIQVKTFISLTSL